MDYRRYLKHYGVLGMHWGVRKKEATSPRKQPKPQEDENKKKKKEGLSDRQKLLLKIGAAAVIGGLAAYGGYKLYKLYNLDTSSLKTPLIPKADTMLMADKLKSINPLRTTDINDPNFAGTNLNCPNCAIAEELFMRGDTTVRARLSKTGMLPSQIGEFFHLKPDSISELNLDNLGDPPIGSIDERRGFRVQEEIENFLFRSQPEGARGTMGIRTIQGGHLMFWRRTKMGAEIDNPQDPTIHIPSLLSMISTKEQPVKFTRLDNAEINTDNINEMVSHSLSDVEPKFNIGTIKGENFVMELLSKESTKKVEEMNVQNLKDMYRR